MTPDLMEAGAQRRAALEARAAQQTGGSGGRCPQGPATCWPAPIPTIMPTLLPMFLKSFNNRYPKVKLVIEELNTEEIITRLKNGHLDAAIAATPLEEEKIKEVVLYFEPFVAYIPGSHPLSQKSEIDPADLNVDEILLLQDGHCFRDGILNLCKRQGTAEKAAFQIESGSFETLVRLSDEGLGTTLLPYLHTLDLDDKHKARLHHFREPRPAREVSLVFPKTELKIHIIDALRVLAASADT